MTRIRAGEIERGKDGHLHNDEHGTDDDALDSSAQDWFRNDGQGLVDDHVGQEEGDEEKVSILANRDDLLDVLALLSVSRTGQVSAQDKCVRALTAYR